MKKHILKRPLTTLVLAAVMILTMGLACATYADNGVDGNINWNHDASLKILTVGVVDKSKDASDRCIDYGSGAAPWASYVGSIKKIVVLDGVHGINGQSFSNYGVLEKVELADSVKEITEGAFKNDFCLESVKHNTGDCELRGDDDNYPFDGCNEGILTFDTPVDSFLAECCKHHGLRIKNAKGSLMGAYVKSKWMGDPLLPEEPADGYWYFTKKQWTGKDIKAVPEVQLYGHKLIYGEDFTCTYSKNKNVGQATVYIKGKGDYCDSMVEYFIIYPKGTSISKLTAGKKKLTVKWRKQDKKMSKKRIDRYQVQVATNKAFTKNVKTKSVKGYKATTKTIRSLKSKKTYYVRVRTVMSSGLATPVRSNWSPVKKIKVR